MGNSAGRDVIISLVETGASGGSQALEWAICSANRMDERFAIKCSCPNFLRTSSAFADATTFSSTEQNVLASGSFKKQISYSISPRKVSKFTVAGWE